MQINFILAQQPYIIVVRTLRRGVAVPLFSLFINIRVLHYYYYYYYYYYYIVAQSAGLECECANLISFPFFTGPTNGRKKTSMAMRNKLKHDYIYAIRTLYYD
jgi:hypothetical protein